MSDKKIYLCAINNIESGTCDQDCTFCTQSTKYKANIQRYKMKSVDQIVNEAKIAKQNKAMGYCLVTAGVGLNDTRVDFVSRVAYAITKEKLDLQLIACNGLATIEQLKELKKYGINRYNHNLEASQEFYSTICTTHSWQDRYTTCQNIKSLDMKLICGGIFGMGETIKDRDNLMSSIKSLTPTTVPINFFHPNEALPIKENTLTKNMAFEIIKNIKNVINPQKLMVAGGRESMFGDEQYKIFDHGANAIVIGDYLTTNGQIVSKDLQEINNLGYTIARCD